MSAMAMAKSIRIIGFINLSQGFWCRRFYTPKVTTRHIRVLGDATFATRFDFEQGLSSFTSRCQLSARRQNVASARTSDVDVNPSGFKNLAKRFDALCRRRMIRQRLGGIVRNQVYLCPQRMPVDQVRELS